jgi:hypothetical protein
MRLSARFWYWGITVVYCRKSLRVPTISPTVFWLIFRAAFEPGFPHSAPMEIVVSNPPGIGGTKAGWGSSASPLAAPGAGSDRLSWNAVPISGIST